MTLFFFFSPSFVVVWSFSFVLSFVFVRLSLGFCLVLFFSSFFSVWSFLRFCFVLSSFLFVPFFFFLSVWSFLSFCLVLSSFSFGPFSVFVWSFLLFCLVLPLSLILRSPLPSFLLPFVLLFLSFFLSFPKSDTRMNPGVLKQCYSFLPFFVLSFRSFFFSFFLSFFVPSFFALLVFHILPTTPFLLSFPSFTSAFFPLLHCFLSFLYIMHFRPFFFLPFTTVFPVISLF